MHEIRAITIDLDDTLWDTMPVLKRAEQRLFAWMQDNHPRVAELFPKEKAIELRAQVVSEHADMLHDLTFVRRVVLSRMGVAAGYGEAWVDEAFDVFDDARNDIDPFPEVRPALEQLRERFVLIAVTNGNADLVKIGIDDLFADIVYARDVGAAKPDAKIFAAAVEAGGAKAAETLHAGDHPEYDVHGAREAGLHAVWVNRLQRQWPDDLSPPATTIDHVGELMALFDD